MTDLPGSLAWGAGRAGLAVGPRRRLHERRATDGTRKLLVRMRDGATVETVLIPGVSGGREALPLSRSDDDADAAAATTTRTTESEPVPTRASPVRVTQCISTQVGCAMGCVFCASGVAGLKRHLGADEIVAQVLAGRARLEAGERLRNVVYMGMGEPLHNYDATVRALRLLTHPEGIGALFAAHHRLDQRPGPRDRAARARTSAATSAWPSPCTRPTTRRARASCPSTRSTRSPC